jgi:hypothetical protein
MTVLGSLAAVVQPGKSGSEALDSILFTDQRDDLHGLTDAPLPARVDLRGSRGTTAVHDEVEISTSIFSIVTLSPRSILI